jgi:alanine dehydrogenase
MKISPPTEQELTTLREGQTLISVLHLAIARRTTFDILLKKKATAIALELIENQHGELVLLHVMSEIAGQISIHVAAQYLQAGSGGRGLLLGSLPGVPSATVVILGAGMVGRTAARAALGLGARVVMLDKDLKRLRDAEEMFQWRITTAIADRYYIERAVAEADVVIGAVLLQGGEKTPHVVSESMVKQMKPGSVIVDVSIDQGGCVETSRPTTLADPVYIVHNVIHYCVPNIPSAVARTASVGLSNTLLPYLHEVGTLGVSTALKEDSGLAKGVCTMGGHCTNRAAGRIFGVEVHDVLSQIH